MSNRLALALKPGDAIHIGPHDIFRGDVYPIHKDTREADVRVDAVVPSGSIVVIMWHDGPVLGAVVYDGNDLVQLLERAA